MKARVDQSLCIGCGLCIAMSPDVFQLNDDGLAENINDELEDSLVEGAQEARDSCPVDAISVEE